MPISISLLGCGHPHLSDLLGVIASEPDLRLAAAWDADRSAIPGAIANYVVSDAERAIRRADAVVVIAATDQRPELCVRAARAGRPVLVEKPIARTAAEARALAREIARSRTPAMPALFLRELPALHRLQGVLRAGLLGRLSAASASYLHAGALDGSLSGPLLDARSGARRGGSAGRPRHPSGGSVRLRTPAMRCGHSPRGCAPAASDATSWRRRSGPRRRWSGPSACPDRVRSRFARPAAGQSSTWGWRWPSAAAGNGGRLGPGSAVLRRLRGREEPADPPAGTEVSARRP
jgi:hypothetical protein